MYQSKYDYEEFGNDYDDDDYTDKQNIQSNKVSYRANHVEFSVW